MTLKTLALAASILALTATAAAARDLYDDVFFVRAHATAADLFGDRADCRNTADHMSDTDAFYSNPRYGALSAMSSALDEDSLHDGGLQKRLHRAVFDDCMREKGWVAADVSRDELKVLLRADVRHPAPLDAWLKAHEPPPAPRPQPASQVIKATAETVAPAKSAN